MHFLIREGRDTEEDQESASQIAPECLIDVLFLFSLSDCSLGEKEREEKMHLFDL